MLRCRRRVWNSSSRAHRRFSAVCLAAHEWGRFAGHTPGNVKLLLPPRQSRGTSFGALDQYRDGKEDLVPVSHVCHAVRVSPTSAHSASRSVAPAILRECPRDKAREFDALDAGQYALAMRPRSTRIVNAPRHRDRASRPVAPSRDHRQHSGQFVSAQGQAQSAVAEPRGRASVGWGVFGADRTPTSTANQGWGILSADNWGELSA
jgi:hypothetical protein